MKVGKKKQQHEVQLLTLSWYPCLVALFTNVRVVSEVVQWTT